MRYAYVRCMDGHYYRLTDNPCCPLDGWLSPAAQQLRPTLGEVTGLSLDALAEAGADDSTLADVLIAEMPDAQPVPELLRPWLAIAGV